MNRIAITLLVLLSASLLFAETGFERLLKKIESTPVSMEYDLEIYWAIREKTDKKSGELLLGENDMFSVSLGNSLWISDGVIVWQYSESNNQVIIRNFLDMDLSLHPTSLFERFEKRTFVKTESKKNSIYVWNSETDLEYRSIEVVLNMKETVLESVKLEDPEGNITTYTFSDMKFLDTIEDSRFTFNVPEGVELFDER